MHLVNRHHRVRLEGARGVSASHVLSYPRAQWPARLTRYRDEDWVYDRRSGLVLPAIRGGVGWNSFQHWAASRLSYGGIGAAQTTLALDSAYTYNSAGDAIASIWRAPAALGLTAAYVFITAYTGTAANVNDLNFELRDHSTNKPGSTLHTSGSVNPSSATGWIQVTGLSFTTVADTVYWGVLADADGNGTDFATVLRNVPNEIPNHQMATASQSTDGFTTAGASTSLTPSLMLRCGDVATIGWPFTASTSPSNNTNRRGLNMSTGPSAPMKLYGMVLDDLTLSNGTSVEVWANGSGPSGTPTGTATMAVMAGANTAPTAGFAFAAGTGFMLQPGTPYRIVFTFSGNSVSCARMQIGTGSDAALRRARWGGGDYYWAQANATTDWSNDNVDEFPSVFLIKEDLFDPDHFSAVTRGRTRPVLVR